MAPIPIQLALQGGGAKLCALMAAMHAVQELEEEKVLKVTRLAGTSAGSIVASLFAAGHNFAMLRTRVRDNRERLRRVVPLHSSRILSTVKILAGRPVWSMKPLKLILNDLFKDKQVSTFGDLEAAS
jgi:NTE family protein